MVDPTGHESVIDSYNYQVDTHTTIVDKYWKQGSDYFSGDHWYQDDKKLDVAVSMLKLEADLNGGLNPTMAQGHKRELLERLSSDVGIVNGVVNSLQINYEDAFQLSSGNIEQLYKLRKGNAQNAAVLDGTAMIAQGLEILIGAWFAKYCDKLFGYRSGFGSRSISSIDDLFNNPRYLAKTTPKELYNNFKINGYNPKPLGDGLLEGIPFEEGGGFRINWGGDKAIFFNPKGNHHGGVPYYKFSSGAGTTRYDVYGNPL
jgi:hypothetical protein